MSGARTAMALYVAVAVHVLGLMVLLLLLPDPQQMPGRGEGIGIGLDLRGEDSALTREKTVAQSSLRPRALQESKPDRPARELSAAGPDAFGLSRAAAAQPGGALFSPADHAVASKKAGGGGRDNYLARLRLHLSAFRRELPAGTRPGEAEVRFRVETDGRVAFLSLFASSGSADLDAEALRLIQRAQPLPRPPGGGSLELVVPIGID